MIHSNPEANLTKLHKVIYLAFGSFFILHGVVTLVAPTFLASEAQHSFHLAHNLREQELSPLSNKSPQVSPPSFVHSSEKDALWHEREESTDENLTTHDGNP